ncbi:MAG: Hsp20/alpha crystallin family protein [Pirellulales bacterium]|nr:Hsp20/alpha crystallin family protein [Pirellulales bacterium]
MFFTRWSPWNDLQSEMSRLQSEVNRLFGRYGSADGKSGIPGYPPINIWEDEDQLFVEAELPGMELDDLEIYVNGGNQLSLKGERKQPGDNDGTWHRRERGYGKFARIVELPHLVDADQVNANFKHGVLTIMLPKQAASKPRKIEVKAE